MNCKRDNLYKLKDLLDQYFKVIEVGKEATFEYIMLYLKNVISMNDKQMSLILKKELKNYLQNLRNEIKICNYVLKNSSKIHTNDMFYAFELLDAEYENKYQYINDIFESFSTALIFESKDRFYLPKKRYKDLTEFEVNLYKEYLKGFNIESLRDFMIGEEKIYTTELFEETQENSKIYDVDAQEFIDFFEIFIKENDEGTLTTMPILPKVKDEKSFLVNIHLLTRNALLVRDSINKSDDLVYKEDLAIFYELLYKSRNSFAKTDLHTSEISQRLLAEYKNEPFLEQIEKVKFYSKNSTCR